jgi:hypothetical protein
MSYGLPWAEAFAPLLEGRPALGVINLGNVEHVKRLMPEAVTILVDASLDTIRHRLIARGVNTPEQIEERLSNAARVQNYRKFYDYVVTNEEGGSRKRRPSSAISSVTFGDITPSSSQPKRDDFRPSACLGAATKVSTGCAPERPTRRSKTKNGTPETPIASASCTSSETASA